MTVPLPHLSVAGLRPEHGVGAPEDMAEFLAPIAAGAHARGIAEAFEMMGAAAILVDRSGEILHCGVGVERSVGPCLRIVGGHLFGADAESNGRLARFLSQLVEGTAIDDVDIGVGEARRRLRALRLPAGKARAQLLHAVVLIEAPQV